MVDLSFGFVRLFLLYGLVRSRELNDPFLLPFGRQNGDKFATRNGCSLGEDLEHSFKIGNQTVNKVYACLDGVLKFSIPEDLFKRPSFEDFDEMNYTIVAPFFSQHRIDHHFLDEKCLYSVEENSFYLYGDYWCRETYEDSFNDHYQLYWSNWVSSQSLNPSEQENHLNRIKQLHDRELTEEELQQLVHDDDGAARTYFGKNTTKYVNLANNIMRRQVTHGEELNILTKLIQQSENSSDVVVDWALIVTWYKIRVYCTESDWSMDDTWIDEHHSLFRQDTDRCFASFQLILTCSPQRCFSIFNYFEINGRPRLSASTRILCGLFTYQSNAYIVYYLLQFHRKEIFWSRNN